MTKLHTDLVVKRDKKPILIDALHINMGGALMILNHLVNRLIDSNINFLLLKDARCPKLQSEDKVKNLEVLPATTKVRKLFYKTRKTDFATILCLGNVPPPIKLDAPVHTYIHNVSLLEIPHEYPLKWKVLNFLKLNFIRFYAKNTDNWIVQTKHTSNLVRKYLPCKGKFPLIYPFFNLPYGMNHTSKDERHDYVFIGEFTWAKGHEYLIEAWEKLTELKFYPTLHLTVSSPQFIPKIEKAIAKGARIINHGHVTFEEVIKIYNLSKATVYPSLNESLGLGIIEAIEAGCDVIGCNLPYLDSVCKPSVAFVPCNSDAIVEAILNYESKSSPRTKLTIKDMVNEFISFIIRN